MPFEAILPQCAPSSALDRESDCAEYEYDNMEAACFKHKTLPLLPETCGNNNQWLTVPQNQRVEGQQSPESARGTWLASLKRRES